MTDHNTNPQSVLNDPKLTYLREGMMGFDSEIATPFGRKRRIYLDYIASGLPFKDIEKVIADRVLPHMANTHTESNTSGKQITFHVENAYSSISKAVGATDEDVLIFVGAGSTAAINRLILAMGLRIPEQAAQFCNFDNKIICDKRPIIFRSLMEHHSNDIAWRETIAETRFVAFNKRGLIDWRDLERQLKDPKVRDHPMKIGTFSAGSNVTGLLTDVDSLAKVMHDAGGYAFFDYAAAAPYVKVDLHPDGDELKRKDAVFISTHKFAGGPQAPGILVANKKLFTSKTPVEPGGGTVLYTSPWDHRYLNDVKMREGGGTPPIIQIIRAGLVFDLKKRIGEKLLMAAEHELVSIAKKRILANPALALLGTPNEERLGVFSIIFHGGELHHNLAVRLLNDRFGIQVRAGCMCAGTYGHELLGIEQEKSEIIRRALTDGELTAKPGWVRLSISPATSREDLEFALDAIDQISNDWKQYADKYAQDNSGEFHWAGDDFNETFEPLTLPPLDKPSVK